MGQVFELDIGFGEKLAAVIVEIAARIDHALDACVDEHLGAGQTGLVGNVGGCAFAADTVQRRLDDGILLGVEGSHAMTIRDQMAYLVAMGQTGG